VVQRRLGDGRGLPVLLRAPALPEPRRRIRLHAPCHQRMPRRSTRDGSRISTTWGVKVKGERILEITLEAPTRLLPRGCRATSVSSRCTRRRILTYGKIDQRDTDGQARPLRRQRRVPSRGLEGQRGDPRTAPTPSTGNAATVKLSGTSSPGEAAEDRGAACSGRTA